MSASELLQYVTCYYSVFDFSNCISSITINKAEITHAITHTEYRSFRYICRTIEELGAIT